MCGLNSRTVAETKQENTSPGPELDPWKKVCIKVSDPWLSHSEHWTDQEVAAFVQTLYIGNHRFSFIYALTHSLNN